MRRFLIVALVVAAVALGASRDPRRLAFIKLYGLFVGAQPLDRAEDEGPEARWFDDYYTVHKLSDRTYAIGEPRYHDRNFNYLIVGDRRALLFDSGPGVRDIVPVVKDLTALTVTAVPSHLHYDHIGNHTSFALLGMVDLPHLRERVRDSGVLRPTDGEHLGFVEGFQRPYLHISEWLPVGGEVDLGGRKLEVLHTPGHTAESISLFDTDADMIFVGDFLTEGPSFAFVPGSNLGDYLRSANAVLGRIGPDTRVFGAHRLDGPGVPELTRADVVELRDTLLAMRDGEISGSGVYPVFFSLGDGRPVAADLFWGRSWD